MITNTYQKERLARMIVDQSNTSMSIYLVNQVSNELYEVQYDNDKNTKQLIKINKFGVLSTPKINQVYHK